MPTPQPDHYRALGIPRDSTPEQIRSAFRKLVLKFHPDRSKDPKTVDAFMRITAAYEVLSDPDRKANYDRLLNLTSQPNRPSTPPSTRARPPGSAAPQARSAPPSEAVERLREQLRRGKLFEAEITANEVLRENPKSGFAYGVLGDIARTRGDYPRASKMYAFALQMEPGNAHYLNRHLETLSILNQRGRQATGSGSTGSKGAAFLIGVVSVLLAGMFIATSPEKSALSGVTPVDTWTVGLLAVLALCGIAVGAALSISRLVDRFDATGATTMGRITPWVALMFVAVVNFWASCLLFLVVSSAQRVFDSSTTRLLASVGGVVAFLSLSALVSRQLDPLQVFLWGGNVSYVGAVCGWMVADALGTR